MPGRSRFYTAGLLLALLVTASASAASVASLLWDNYQSTGNPAYPDGWDGVGFLSSESDASVEDSWVIDDAVFESDVVVQAVEWLGLRKTGYNYTAEVIILDTEFNLVAERTDLFYTALQTEPNTPIAGFKPYKALTEFTNVELPAGRYYFGVRLKNGTDAGLGGGRNFILTTGDGNIQGETPGAFKAPAWGYPAWTYTNAMSTPINTDFAFRVRGIPEPASILALGLLALLRRR